MHKANVLPHLSSINHRYDYIDGLRGLAAILVVCSHSWRFRDIGFVNNEITKADYFYIGNFGALGVQIFFCITGFLFFKKIISQGLEIDWKIFYISRLKRLAPLYIAFCLCVIIVGIMIAGLGAVNGSALTSAAKLLTFGFMGGKFTIGDYDSGYITPILWTLPYEWKFYFSIPVIAVICSSKKTLLVSTALVAAIYICISISDNFNVWVFFLSGGLAAYLDKFKSPVASSVASISFYIVAVLVMLTMFSHEIDKYGAFRAVTTTILFICAIIGKPLILRLKGLIYAGEISYGIYLFHLMVIFIFNHLTSKHLLGENITGYEVLALVSAYCAALTLITSLTFKYIEYPFMRKK